MLTSESLTSLRECIDASPEDWGLRLAYSDVLEDAGAAGISASRTYEVL